DRTARGFDLARSDPLRLERLQAVGAEVQVRARLRRAVDTALVLLAEFFALGLEHFGLLWCRRWCGLRTRLSTAAGFGLGQALILGHRIVFHDLALEDPNFHSARSIGRLRGGDAIVDVSA